MSGIPSPRGIEVLGPQVPGTERVLTPDALAFVARLVRRFGAERQQLLSARADRQRRFDDGELPGFLPATAAVREADWIVAPAPADLDDRRVEITGPAEAKMMINALNSGARVFMADLEDAMSPPWGNVVAAQVSLMDAVRRTLEYTSPDGRGYHLGDRLATLVVRPRGWHLEEPNLRVDRRPVSASLLDFGLHFFHNAAELIRRGSGPYFYIPKLESHLEARLWNAIFDEAQDALGIPHGTIRATVLIETVVAAFEMDEILYGSARTQPDSTPGGGTTSSARSRNSAGGPSSSCPTGRRSRCRCPSCGRTPSCWCRPATAARRTPSAGWRPSSRPAATRK
jgi:malate synthase